jgi:hypothetical protein
MGPEISGKSEQLYQINRRVKDDRAPEGARFLEASFFEKRLS